MSNAKKKNLIGPRIKFARKSVGMSQEDLAKVLKLTNKAVSTYEVGRALPSIVTLKEISRVTYKPITYFMAEPSAAQDEVEQKIMQIEAELLEVKKLLKSKKYYEIEREE